VKRVQIMLDKSSDSLMCRRTGQRLSDYLDSTLSAREMFEVEKHLAACTDCAEQVRLLEQTVQVLHSAESFDVSDQFMAKLHSRLDDLGPVPSRRSPLAVVREWLYDIRQQLNARPIPTLSVGMASFFVAAVLFSYRPQAVTPIVPVGVETVSQDALDRHVAVTASNPFDDPVAAKLEAESSGADGTSRTSAD
jgi:anti-sigma factor RsiW